MVEDDDTVAKQIIEELFRAESLDELLAPSELPRWESLIEAPVEVFGVQWRASEYEDGPPMYAVVELVDTRDGEKQRVHCGAQKVMAQLFVAEQRGWLPFRCVLRQASRPTKSGYYPLHLERLQ